MKKQSNEDRDRDKTLRFNSKSPVFLIHTKNSSVNSNRFPVKLSKELQAFFKE